MQAVLCQSYDGPDALIVGEVGEPSPGPNEVLLRVHAASVSFMDALMVSGGYQMRPKVPFVPGTDAAGVVDAVGQGVTSVRPGDRVIATAWHGAYAQKMVVSEERCLRLPDAVADAAASTVAHSYLTAHHALVQRAAVMAGETLLITGASGGVGLAALDVGRLLGARTIACVGSAQKVEIVTQYGASQVINLAEADLRSTVKALTEGRGIDVCFETVGGEVFLTLARLMAFGGRIMPIGFAGGTIPSLPMNLPLLKGYSVVGVFMGAWFERNTRVARSALEMLLAHVAAGRLHPHVDRVMPLGAAAEAMRLIAHRQVTGRIVLDPRL